ncbi:hypothetical protein E2C01_044574 [Portunus trituberculatus]|uniref:Uncharacterized protein n=1 Tax=Portunus trituberculatus TaxID=210409 RepID=A0A5B7FZL0_PORTR|nr:hypothetical protein [Portunus trituberculatus]
MYSPSLTDLLGRTLSCQAAWAARASQATTTAHTTVGSMAILMLLTARLPCQKTRCHTVQAVMQARQTRHLPEDTRSEGCPLTAVL